MPRSRERATFFTELTAAPLVIIMISACASSSTPRPKISSKSSCAAMSVGRDRDLVATGHRFDHHKGGVALTIIVGWRNGRLHDQTRRMLHQHTAQAPQTRFTATGPHIQAGVGSVVD
jgi:hypothetical protein